MLKIITGAPGAGKTLLTIAEVKARAEKEKREVYFHNIKDLKLPWRELDDPESWPSVPVNSIVVLDEAQKAFRPRHYAKEVPEFVSALETHRHRGIDIYFVTQHPGLIDSNVRKLAGEHVHFVRQFGSNLVKRYQWMEYKDDVHARGDAEMSLVKYPTDLYSVYKSAEVHTHKFALPGSMVRALIVAALLPLGAWGVYKALQRMGGESVTPSSLFSSHSALPGGSAAQSSSVSALSAKQYVASFVPRVYGLAYTAPVFDKLTQAKSAPTPAGCVRQSKRCQCYTEQGTPIDVSEPFCAATVEHGLFRYWLANDREMKGGTDARSAAAPPVVSQASTSPAPVVSAPVGAAPTGTGEPFSGQPSEESTTWRMR